MNATIWTSVDGGQRSFSAMEDSHLANLLLHLKYYNSRYWDLNTKAELCLEIKRRNLSDDFINGAPYPWRHNVTGIWYIWDFEKGYAVRVSGNKDN